jgi:quinoprotein glucose dehydrogenase
VKRLTLVAIASLAACELPGSAARIDQTVDWPAYGRDPGGSRFSPAREITRDNVSQLELAWTYRTGDWVPGRTRFEATPLFVGGALLVSTPLGRVIALDADTGRERWSYDPKVDLSGAYGDFANRGVAIWRDPRGGAAGACSSRVFVAPIDARLIALDAVTGRPCEEFGVAGQIDLKHDLINPPFEHGEYQITSPPAVAGDVVIVGSSIGDNNRLDTPSGVVRAFDARSGAQRWRWDPIPRAPGIPGYETWRGSVAHRTGSANVWSVIALDTARDLVFLPTGSAAPDFYGGERRGQNLYANSLVALQASSGRYVWHFQAVHHDLWDYDLPAQPALVTLRHGGRAVPAVVVVSKMGHMFVLDRLTGVPLMPVEERPVPASDVPGEAAWPTQPVPTRPRPLVPQSLTAASAWGAPPDREWCRRTLAGLRSDGMFTPPSLRGSVIFPGNIGGSNWGGVAIDPARALAITPTNRLATVVRLVPRADFDAVARASSGWQATPQRGTPYGMMRRSLIAPSGVPCNPPPWGALSAVDLGTGDVKWEVPLGIMPALRDTPGADTLGALNLGGAMITAGGLVFVAGTPDERIRAFDVESGRLLWQTTLPAAGNAMPMTYQLPSGRQFVVIAAGGRPPLWRQGDYVVAYALPRARAARPAARADFGGAWSGELLLGRSRLAVALDLRGASDTVMSGGFAITTPRVHGTMTASVRDGRLIARVPFDNADERCAGVAQGALELANHGRLLVGELRITGSCSDGAEIGALALRRP